MNLWHPSSWGFVGRCKPPPPPEKKLNIKHFKRLSQAYAKSILCLHDLTTFVSLIYEDHDYGQMSNSEHKIVY